MKTQLVKKSVIAFSVCAIIFAACKKSDQGITSTTDSSTVTAEEASVSTSAARTGNQSPRAKAGADQTIVLPATLSLDGSGSSDADGSIVSYQWTKEVGPDATITSATSAQTTVTGIATGDYRFKLTVTDNKGSTGSDTLHIVVTGVETQGNQTPVVNAGSAQTITLPASSVTLSGSATDADGTIASYLWTKTSGTGGNITSPASASTTVTGLTAGSYVFNLQATDNSGASGSKTVTITVNSGTTPANQAPVVNAGSAQTITLPVSSVSLNGSATDADGTIASYLWTKTSGTGGTIVNPNSASTTVTGLTAGSYVFNLKATDNSGASSNKSVSITVNPAITTPPPAGNYGTLLYSTGYNALSDIINSSNQQGNGGLSTTIYKDGPGSFKSVPANVSAGIRSEVQYSSSMTPTEGAIEYDVLYETIFQNNGHSLQFHPNTSGGSASPGLWHENGKFVWVNWKGGTNTKYATNFTIPQNKWMHIVFEYKVGSAGYMKFTIDGVVVLNKTNIQVGDGSGQYLKVGVNMWANQSSTVYYDNLKIWKK